MNDLISKYGTQLITGFIAICGILFGLFWNQFFAWRRNKREQKAKLNHLLFHLLELYFFVSRNDFNYFINIYMLQIEESFGSIPQKDKAEIEHSIMTTLKEKLSKSNEEEIKRLSDHYEAAVKEVAFINPFLAYRLAGQSRRFNNLDLLNKFLDSLHDLLSTQEQQKLVQNIFANYNDNRFITEMLKDIKDIIIETSKEIGFLKQFEAKKHFVSHEKSKREEIEKEVKTIIKQLKAQIPIQ